MAVITPQTDVYLLKCPLEISDINQLTFSNATAQYNYFNSLPKLALDGFTYQRKDGTIRYAGKFDDLIGYNYVMYRNEGYSNKWFYAYITGMEYLNDNVTAISIKTDVWQTWQFDLQYKPVLVDREHTNDDGIGKNTLPEGLELGEFIVNGRTVNFAGDEIGPNEHFYTIIEVSQVENTGTSSTLSYRFTGQSTDLTPKLNGIERGTIPLIIGGGFVGSTSGQERKPDQITHLYDIAGLSDSIVNMYLLPENLVGGFVEIELSATGGSSSSTLDGIGVPLPSITTQSLIATSQTFTRPSTLNGYTPKNNKLKTYPFMYFNISNNSGSSVPYRYEDFSGSIAFDCEGTFGVSGSVKAIPKSYKGMNNSDNSLDYSVNGGKYPVCSWNSDSYTNWLTQNSVNMRVAWTRELIGGASNLVSSGIEGASQGSVGKGIGAGLVGTGLSMMQLAREQHLAKTTANMVSDQVKGNTGAGDFVWAKYRTPFTYLPMSIKAEYARCIDEFFSQYGYKCNRVKTPNITGRRNWNYVKTIGCYIDGDVPQDDMQEIKSMFDKGITLWHNPATFADYSQNNDII